MPASRCRALGKNYGLLSGSPNLISVAFKLSRA